MIAVLRKELADHFTSVRFVILMVLAFMVSALTLYSAYRGIRGTTTEEFVFLRLFTTELSDVPFSFLFNFVNFLALFFIPIIGIFLGFDAINRERSSGTLSRIMSQPIFRDSVINGKFLAGIVILTIMMASSVLLVSGFGLRMIGVPPTAEEIIRLFLYLVFIIVYGAFWMGLAILFSVLFRSVASSLLSSIAIWIFFSFGMLVIAMGVGQTEGVGQTILLFSPSWLFADAATPLLYPTVRTLGTLTEAQSTYMLANPLSLGQSITLIWPYLTSLVSLSAICFAASYILFMRQEIRAT